MTIIYRQIVLIVSNRRPHLDRALCAERVFHFFLAVFRCWPLLDHGLCAECSLFFVYSLASFRSWSMCGPSLSFFYSLASFRSWSMCGPSLSFLYSLASFRSWSMCGAFFLSLFIYRQILLLVFLSSAAFGSCSMRGARVSFFSCCLPLLASFRLWSMCGASFILFLFLLFIGRF